MERLISLLGLVTMIFLAWLMSSDRRKIDFRVVIGGVVLQFAFALFILRTDVGTMVFDRIGILFETTFKSVEAGSQFMFNIYPNSTDPDEFRQASENNTVPAFMLLRSFAFGVLPTVIFFSALMSMLYHLGVMQKIVAVFAWVMQRTLGTSGAESLSAASNIFVGQTEAPLVIKPYLASMTMSELNAVMVGGFATIAGGVMAAYVQFGMDSGHLVTASVISAPAALLLAKIIVPETETSVTAGQVKLHVEKTSVNVVEAIAAGASDGMKLALNIGAMLIAFLGLIAAANIFVGWLGEFFGYIDQNRWTLERLFGFVFWPFAWIMGIPQHDCSRAGELIGLKMAANEFVAFASLSEWLNEPADTKPSPRTVLIMTYALAGFANLSSIGIQIGGIGAIAPERRSDLAKLGFKAMLAGTLAAFMTACIAGILV